MRIGCSGHVGERSGIGVVQKHLYAHLTDAGHELIFSQRRVVGSAPLARVRGFARGLRPARGPVDAYLSAVPPLPFHVTAPLLTIVHDLRWSRTRSRAGATYRAWDLRRSVQRSDALLCISDTTRRDLIEFDSRARSKAAAQWLGPGQVPERAFRESDSGLLMLVGGAPHKRNEYAATVLASARPSWIRGVIGVGVTEQVRETLRDVLPCRWFSAVSDDEMLGLYDRAQYFLMLGTDEGFGLPFIEALAAGCQVIATDHALAREVIGAAGLLLVPGDAEHMAGQLHHPPSIAAEVRARHVENFSWTAFGKSCESELLRIAKREPS